MLVEGSLTTIWFDVLPLLFIPTLVTMVDTKNVQEIYTFSCMVLGGYIILWFLGYKIRHWDFEAKYVFEAEIEKLYRAKTIKKDGLAMDKIGTGKVQSIIQKGIIRWSDGMWQMIYQIPRVLFGLGSGFYITTTFGYQYVLLFLIFVVVSGVSYYIFRKKELKFQEKINELDDQMSAQSVRMIMSRQEIVFADSVEKEVSGLLEINKKQKDLQRVGQKWDFMADMAISSTVIILPIAGVLLSVFNKDIFTLSGVLIVPFIYFASRFSFLMWQLVWAVRQFLDVYPQVKKFWEFVDDTPTIAKYSSGKKFVHGGGGVVLQDVGFKYDEKEEKSVLENFNLTIASGEKLALVGHSGSGKTTIAKLISGYMQPTSGTVKIDNQDLSSLALKTYYKYLGYLTQEPMVFDGTIKENMLYALSDEDIKQFKSKKLPRQNFKGRENFATPSKEGELERLIIESLEKAQCDFVFSMKKGIETEIGEKGIRLSGGERQRLAIAKLFLKNPEIIILDEPTSALDSFSEDKISKALEELFKGRTTIIIAHRLQTVKKADRILVIENGKIVEEGTHAELIQRNGIYNDMLNMQSGF